MNSWQTSLQHAIDKRREDTQIRQHLTYSGPQSIRLKIAGKPYLNFSSNDYLGLANHPKMIEAVQSAVKLNGVGSGSAHLVVGHNEEHYLLEEELAHFLGVEKALLFSTGFMANYGVLTGLFNKKDLLLEDKLNHASLIDGGLASQAKMLRYRHNDLNSLEQQLTANSERQTMIVTDGVFSMDGDQAQLVNILKLARRHNANLMVDDAHGFGVLGNQGRGSLEEQKISNTECAIYMATLGKAVGGFGAFVAGSKLIIESLIQFSRSYIYTTAMPPAVAAANRVGLELLKKEDWRREQLNKNITLFKQLANQYQLPLMNSKTAIQPILIGDSGKVINMSKKLRDEGLLVVAIRPPTVAKNSSRLRVTLNAEHSAQQIESLVKALDKFYPR